MNPIYLQQIHTVYWSGLTIGIGSLQDNSAHRNIRESLLGSAGVGNCTGLSNRCTLGLANQQAGNYISATELDINRFRPLPFGELVSHISTQVNGIYLADYITVFNPRRDELRCFIPFLVYALVYPSIASNLVILATLIHWSYSVCMYT